jgi:hypothetical protein
MRAPMIDEETWVGLEEVKVREEATRRRSRLAQSFIFLGGAISAIGGAVTLQDYQPFAVGFTMLAAGFVVILMIRGAELIEHR